MGVNPAVNHANAVSIQQLDQLKAEFAVFKKEYDDKLISLFLLERKIKGEVDVLNGGKLKVKNSVFQLL